MLDDKKYNHETNIIMYSLIVSGYVEDKFNSRIDVEKSRFLEYTAENFRSQLNNLSEEAKDCLKAWPCLLMQEGRGNTVVHVTQITDIQVDRGIVHLTLAPISCSKTLFNDSLWKLRQELDIAEFEFNRNHWAVKDRDLLQLLTKFEYIADDSEKSKFENKPLPYPTRRELLHSRDDIGNWSHTEIDDFLLEAGITGLEAGRAVGSLRDRANAIIQFALNNPETTTAENSLFSSFIVRNTSRSTSEATRELVDTVFPIQEDSETLRDQQVDSSNGRAPKRVFIVHGQNETARTAVVSELKRLGLEPIVLHEQPNMGRHLLTKFIEEAELVTFAVVLMTDDDVGSIKEGKLKPRARQNVILELGYFLAHLGQQRVCALISPGLETPSDFDGIVYIRMDEGGSWQAELERELRAADMPLVEAEK